MLFCNYDWFEINITFIVHVDNQIWMCYFAWYALTKIKIIRNFGSFLCKLIYNIRAYVTNLIFVAIIFTTFNFQGNRAQEVIEGFASKHGLRAIGAIDGSHIAIRPPEQSPENYINRKNFHSIILQAVCDHEMFFTDIYVGWPGSVHDARVFRRSSLCAVLENTCEKMCPQESYLLGDAAYPLRPSLLIPFKDNGNLTEQQKTYNFKHSSSRMKIEHSFGVLKGRWRRLKHLDIVDIHVILDVIVVGCMLHNLCLIHEEDLEEFMSMGEENINECQNMPLFPNTQTGVAKRLAVMAEIC